MDSLIERLKHGKCLIIAKWLSEETAGKLCQARGVILVI